jgi:antitoxin component YwqK of YwqJK toxin-antitoxin module
MKNILITIITTITISFSGISQTNFFAPSWTDNINASQIKGNRPLNKSGQPTGEWEFFYEGFGTSKFATFNYDTYVYKKLRKSYDEKIIVSEIGKLDKDFMRTGTWKIYSDYQWDKVSAIGTYSNGKRDGTWTKYDLENNIIGTSEYVKGSREGIHMELEKARIEQGGLLRTTYTWVNDKRTGPYKLEYLIDDKIIIMESSEYNDNRIVGDKITYDEVGNIAIKTTYNGGSEATSAKYYYKTGEIKATENLKDGYMRDGKFTIYHKNGVVYTIQEYEDEELLNVITTNDSSGKSLDTGTFSNGNGILFSYDAEGNLNEKSKFVNSHETHSSNFQNGELVYEEFYDDKENAIRMIAYKDTVKIRESIIADDYNSNTMITYLNGKKSQEEIFSSNTLIFIDYEDGVIKEKRYHLKSRDVVSKKEIYENGILIEEINYDKD